jgi:hypothetical protein
MSPRRLSGAKVCCHGMPKACMLKVINFAQTYRFWGRPRAVQQPSNCVVQPTPHAQQLPVLCSFLPLLCSVWTEEAQCALLNVSITETFNCSFSCGPDCWKLSQYPCLQVYVNLTSSGERLLLYHTEETMKINQKVGVWLAPPGCLQNPPTFLCPRLSPFRVFQHTRR